MFSYYLKLALLRCRQNITVLVLLAVTMAVGIASCMTTLTIFTAVSGEPMPGVSPGLYIVTMDAREAVERNNNGYAEPDGYLNLTDARALVDGHRAVRQVALAQSYTRVANTDDTKSAEALGLIAYGTALESIGAQLKYGRTWTPAEEAAHSPVIVIDTDVAHRLFGMDNAVGQRVTMGDRIFDVIGVFSSWVPRTQFLDIHRNTGTVVGKNEQFLVPLDAALEANVAPLTTGECGKDAAIVSFQSTEVKRCRWLEVWVTLNSDAAVTAYQQFLANYAQTQRAAGRFVYPPQAKLFQTQAWMQSNRVVPNDVLLNVLLAGAFLFLCMVNVAGLLIARFRKRSSDVAIRRALGAQRRELFAQHLIEAALLCGFGCILALPLTWLGLWIVRIQPVPYAEAANLNPLTLFALLVLSLGVGTLVGVLPAWDICRLSPALQIKRA
jgi:putative ABC transport system permease protein